MDYRLGVLTLGADGAVHFDLRAGTGRGALLELTPPQRTERIRAIRAAFLNDFQAAFGDLNAGDEHERLLLDMRGHFMGVYVNPRRITTDASELEEQ